MKPKQLILCAFVAGLGVDPLGAASGEAAESVIKTGQIEPPILENSISLMPPMSILHLSHNWTEAEVLIRVNTDGLIIDWIPLYLPHHGLFKAVGNALAQARFTSAKMNGIPIVIDARAHLNLQGSGGFTVISETIAEHIESRISMLNPEMNQLVVSSPNQLDASMEIIHQDQTYIPLDESGQVLTGTVPVDFYVDPYGKPRMPRVTGDYPDLLAEAAVMNLREMQFSSPKRSGKPAVIRARMPIVILP